MREIVVLPQVIKVNRKLFAERLIYAKTQTVSRKTLCGGVIKRFLGGKEFEAGRETVRKLFLNRHRGSESPRVAGRSKSIFILTPVRKTKTLERESIDSPQIYSIFALDNAGE